MIVAYFVFFSTFVVSFCTCFTLWTSLCTGMLLEIEIISKEKHRLWSFVRSIFQIPKTTCALAALPCACRSCLESRCLRLVSGTAPEHRDDDGEDHGDGDDDHGDDGDGPWFGECDCTWESW